MHGVSKLCARWGTEYWLLVLSLTLSYLWTLIRCSLLFRLGGTVHWAISRFASAPYTSCSMNRMLAHVSALSYKSAAFHSNFVSGVAHASAPWIGMEYRAWPKATRQTIRYVSIFSEAKHHLDLWVDVIPSSSPACTILVNYIWDLLPALWGPLLSTLPPSLTPRLTQFNFCHLRPSGGPQLIPPLSNKIITARTCRQGGILFQINWLMGNAKTYYRKSLKVAK